MGPASSTGSPMTLMMRPSVPRPTGTYNPKPVFKSLEAQCNCVQQHGGQAPGSKHEIKAHATPELWQTRTLMGPPVLSTFWPRTRPSVESCKSPSGFSAGFSHDTRNLPAPMGLTMAMVRTVLSPTCCATSSTRRILWDCTSRALRMEGSSPSKRTSTTGPITCARAREMDPTKALMCLQWKRSDGRFCAPATHSPTPQHPAPLLLHIPGQQVATDPGCIAGASCPAAALPQTAAWFAL